MTSMIQFILENECILLKTHIISLNATYRVIIDKINLNITRKSPYNLSATHMGIIMVCGNCKFK